MKQTATVELAGGKTLQIETGHLAKQAQGISHCPPGR